MHVSTDTNGYPGRFCCIGLFLCLPCLEDLLSDKTLRKQQELKWPQTWEGKSTCVRKGEVKFDFFN